MSDLERTIRAARESLPGPEQEATERARAAVLAGAPQAPPRRAGRLVLVAVVLVAALAGAFAAGLALAPGGATKAAQADGPGFLPAQGWDTFQTGATTPPQAPTATAANVKLGPDVLQETFPWQTVATLRSGQVLLEVLFAPRGENAAIDAQYRPRSLPLSLADAESGGPFEGQPPNASAERLSGKVNGWNLDLFVFYGGRPTRAARAAAQEELRRLVVPQAPPGALETRRVLQPSPHACRASALRSSVRLQGATGDPARQHSREERRREGVRSARAADRRAARRERESLERAPGHCPASLGAARRRAAERLADGADASARRCSGLRPAIELVRHPGEAGVLPHLPPRRRRGDPRARQDHASLRRAEAAREARGRPVEPVR